MRAVGSGNGGCADEFREPTEERRMTMPSEQSLKILAEIRANMAKLKGCVGPHEWEPQTKLFERRRCTKCGGTMESTASRYYDDGLAHGLKAKKEG
jgi:hypothetical protein